MLFHVVKCFQCCFLQEVWVDSVMQAKNWQCKMCGASQTLQREFTTGSAKVSRLQVQSLDKQNAETDKHKLEYAMKVLTGEFQVPRIEEGASVTMGSGVWSTLAASGDDSIFQRASTFNMVQNSSASSALNPPSWRDFYGQKRESVNRQFFSPQSYNTQMKRSRQGLDWDSSQQTSAFQPSQKKFKEDGHSSRDNAQEMPSSSSKWSSFFDAEMSE